MCKNMSLEIPSNPMEVNSEKIVRTEHRSDFPVEGVGCLVVGGDYQGLGIVRSAGRHGLPTCIVDDERSIARFSRYATHSVRVPDLRDESKTIDSVIEIGRRLGLKGWVIYPTRDETVAAFSRHKDMLSEFFRVPTPDWNITRWAWDKRNTYRKAQELDIPIPKTWFPESMDDLKHIDAEFPLIIKPSIKEHFIYKTRVKAWRVDNRDQLLSRFQEALEFIPVSELMIQDLIPGGSEQQFGYAAFFKTGRAIGSMVTHNQRSHPPQFGRSSTFVTTIELAVLEEMACRFLKAIDYYGLAEVEFRLDPRDGTYKLLDVNARTWGYHALGTAAGVDFPYMLFSDQIGKAVIPARAQVGISWVRLVTDLPVGFIGLMRNQLDFWKYVKSVTSASTESVFSFGDPLPAFAELANIPYLIYKRGF
jgi:D-aspartate ligase